MKIRGRPFASVIGATALGLGLPACLGPAAIAVVNQTDEPFLLRVEGQWVWEVPPGGSGIGPEFGMFDGAKQVEILYSDCSRANMWGVGGSKTVDIRDHEVSERDSPAISRGVSVSGHLAATDECALH